MLTVDQRFAAFGAADFAGDFYCNAPRVTPFNIADRPYFQRLLASQQFTMGEYQIGRSTGIPGLAFAHPILSYAGDLLGAVIATIDLEAVHELTAGTDQPPAGC